MQKFQAHARKPVMRLDELALRGFAESRARAGEFRVLVAHTSRELTKAALSAVSALTRNLGAHVTLLAVQIVPFPLPLDRPDVAPQFVERELAALAREIEVQVDVQVVIARDLETGLQQGLRTSSLVVVAARKRWWPNAEVRLARSLARAGHSVALLGV
jgi:hypothetical protein